MYRYSQQMRAHTGGQRVRQQASKVLLLLLVAAIVVLTILGGNAMSFEAKEQAQFKERMRSEANLAITQVNNLSRTGGSTTTNMLGKLRQHVYAMETLQDVHLALRGNGQRVVDDGVFDSVYAVIDTFDARLQTGQQTKEPLTQLLTLMTELNTKIGGIE
jgi:hypothetical protein